MRDLIPDDDRVIEALLAGRTPDGREDLSDLAAFVRVVERTYHRVPVPSAWDLAALTGAGLTEKGDLPVMAVSNANGPAPQVSGLPKLRTATQRIRKKMLTAISALVGTLAGKVGLGVAVAAASVGALHAADVVDVPGAPDNVPFVDAAGPPDSTPPEDVGVDGSKVAERAAAGEPREDGRAFGLSIAAEASGATPPVAAGPPDGVPGPPESVPGPPAETPGPPEATPGPPDGTPVPPENAAGPPDSRPGPGNTPTGPGDTPAGSRP